MVEEPYANIDHFTAYCGHPPQDFNKELYIYNYNRNDSWNVRRFEIYLSIGVTSHLRKNELQELKMQNWYHGRISFIEGQFMEEQVKAILKMDVGMKLLIEMEQIHLNVRPN